MVGGAVQEGELHEKGGHTGLGTAEVLSEIIIIKCLISLAHSKRWTKVSSSTYYYYYYSNISIVLQQDLVYTAYFYDVEEATPKMQVYFKKQLQRRKCISKIFKGTRSNSKCNGLRARDPDFKS